MQTVQYELEMDLSMKLTSLCYLESGNRYLMLHRTKKEHDENGGKWIGVGGKFENGESPEDCMKREVLEETGLTVLKWRFRGIVAFVSDVWPCEYMHLFTCSEWQGEQQLCDEGDLEWIDNKELFNCTLWEGDKIFLHLLQSDCPFFSLKLTYHSETLVSAELEGKPIVIEDYL